MKKALLVLTSLLCAWSSVSAQDNEFVLLCSPPLDHLTTKQVYEVVTAFDPHSTIRLQPARLELQMHQDVIVDELLNALNALGPVVFSVAPNTAPVLRSVSTSAADAFPQYIDTGDPAADEAAYAAAKQAWLAAHPEFYHQPPSKLNR